MNVCIAIGPAVGGVLLLLGSSATAFFVNAATFLGSAVFVSRIRTDLGPLRAEEHEHATGTWHRPLRGISAITTSPRSSSWSAAGARARFLYRTEIGGGALLAAGRLGMGERPVLLLFAGSSAVLGKVLAD